MNVDELELSAFSAKPRTNLSKAKPLPVQIITESLEIDRSLPSGLRWKERPRHHFLKKGAWTEWNKRHAGNMAGFKQSRRGLKKYWHVEIKSIAYGVHRIVFLLANSIDAGDLHIDHIDGNGLNNNPSNLRLATNSENICNQGKRADNTSGHTGVRWHKPANKWNARIVQNGKEISLGYFATIEEAIAARKAAEPKYHREFSYAASQELAPFC